MKNLINIVTCVINIFYIIMTTSKILPLLNKGEISKAIQMIVAMLIINFLYGVVLLITRNKQDYVQTDNTNIKEIDKIKILIIKVLLLLTAVIFILIFILIKVSKLVLFLMAMTLLMIFMTLYKRTEAENNDREEDISGEEDSNSVNDSIDGNFDDIRNDINQ